MSAGTWNNRVAKNQDHILTAPPTKPGPASLPGPHLSAATPAARQTPWAISPDADGGVARGEEFQYNRPYRQNSAPAQPTAEPAPSHLGVGGQYHSQAYPQVSPHASVGNCAPYSGPLRRPVRSPPKVEYGNGWARGDPAGARKTMSVPLPESHIPTRSVPVEHGKWSMGPVTSPVTPNYSPHASQHSPVPTEVPEGPGTWKR